MAADSSSPTCVSYVQDARKLFNLAQRLHRAQLRQDWERIDALTVEVDALLMPFLMADSPLPLHEFMTEFYAGCEAAGEDTGPGDAISHALEELSETVAVAGEDDTPYRLFAFPMLVPVAGADWSAALTLPVLDACTAELKRAGLLHLESEVLWLPQLVRFSNLLDLSEWSSFHLAQHLIQGDTAAAAELVLSLAGPEEVPLGLSSRDVRLMESRILIGVARQTADEEDEFPLGALVVERLAAEISPTLADAVIDDVQPVLAQVSLALAQIFKVTELQALCEIQGWWQDMHATHEMMRAANAQQKLNAFMAANHLFPQELIAGNDPEIVADEAFGVRVKLYRRTGYSLLEPLLFWALPNEKPEECAHAALEFLASNGIAVLEEALLGAEPAPVPPPRNRTLH